jgi:arylsulfatase A-like enzyme
VARVRNVLFIMADQLRADYLSAYGHPTLKTPNIDALAARGVRFTRAYVQSPVCGPARMSYYTGRYVTSHGATWNNVPPVGWGVDARGLRAAPWAADRPRPQDPHAD